MSEREVLVGLPGSARRPGGARRGPPPRGRGDRGGERAGSRTRSARCESAGSPSGCGLDLGLLPRPRLLHRRDPRGLRPGARPHPRRRRPLRRAHGTLRQATSGRRLRALLGAPPCRPGRGGCPMRGYGAVAGPTRAVGEGPLKLALPRGALFAGTLDLLDRIGVETAALRGDSRSAGLRRGSADSWSRCGPPTSRPTSTRGFARRSRLRSTFFKPPGTGEAASSHAGYPPCPGRPYVRYRTDANSLVRIRF